MFISATHEHDNDTRRHTNRRTREVIMYKYIRLAELDRLNAVYTQQFKRKYKSHRITPSLMQLFLL